MAFLNDVFNNIGRFLSGGNSNAQRDADEIRRREEEKARLREQARAQAQADARSKYEQRRQTFQSAPKESFQPPDLSNMFASPLQKVKQPVDTKLETQKGIDEIYQQKRDKAIADESKKTSWLEKTFADRDWQRRAENIARGQAINEYEAKTNRYSTPEAIQVLKKAIDENRDLSKRSQEASKNLENVQKGMTKVAQVGGYIPGFGSGMSLGGFGIEMLAKATGNTQLEKDTRDARTRIDFDMTSDEFDSLDDETKKKLSILQGIGVAASPLDFVGAGGVARSGILSAAKNVGKEFIAKGLVKDVTKAALKKATISTLKSAAVPTAIGGAMSAGAQAYLTGGKVDPLQTAKDAVTIGASSLLMPSGVDDSLKKAGRNAAETVADVGDEVLVRTPAVEANEVAPGIKSTNESTRGNLAAETAPPVDTNAPAYERKRIADAAAAEQAARDQAEFDADPLNRPAYEHKNDMQKVIDDEQANLDQYVNSTPDITDAQISAARLESQARIIARLDELKTKRYGASPEDTATSIPDPTATRVLAKADDNIVATNEMPMADFSKSINAPLRKAETIVPTQQPELPVATTADINGNVALASDAVRQRALANEGVVPARGDSIVAARTAEMEQAAQNSAREQVNLDNAEAPRVRQQIADRLTDNTLRNDVLESFPEAKRVNLEEVDNVSKAFVNNMTDEQVIARYSGILKVERPDDFFTAVNSIRRLETIGTPEANNSIKNAIDGLTEYAATSGRNLRTTQILFENMPTTMKVEFLINKLSKAGVDMSDADRLKLVNLIEVSDNATSNLRTLEGRVNEILDSGVINNASMSKSVTKEIKDLAVKIREATMDKEIKAGEAWKFFQENLPKTPIGKRFGDTGRTLMLSAPSGRVFDLFSTGATSADDLATKSVSGLLGKVVNLAKGPGTVADSVANPRQLVKGFKEGFRRTVDAFKGKDFVEDFQGRAKRVTRGQNDNTGNLLKRVVSATVEAPTNLSRGLRNDELYRQGLQEAAKQGLKGEARSIYAEARSLVPSEAQLNKAIDAHMRANMLHENVISRALNNLANSMDKHAGGWTAPFIRNQVMPFTSWLGGNIHRTFTDKNVLWNAGSAINNARKGNIQGVVDDISRLAVNSAEAYVVGNLLTKAGIITDTDANGDDYAGLYFHIGDRYIPIAIAGTVSVPIIIGNAIEKASQASENGEDPTKAFLNAISANTLKNAGVSSVFGGENNLQSTISNIASGDSDVLDTVAKYAGDVVRQYIPGVTGDINSIVDYTSFNPTNELAETKVTFENPETGRQKTDVLATELARTQARIPFMSQGLPRQEGKTAKDPLDRAMKSTRETDTMADTRAKTETRAQEEKRLKKEGVPLDDDAIKARIENGDYDKAIAGLTFKLSGLEGDDIPESSREKVRDQIEALNLNKQGIPTESDAIQSRIENGDYDQALSGYEYQLSNIEDDKDVPESDKAKLRDKITTLTVTRDGNYSPQIIKAYSEISNTEWRELGDSTSEYYDPELYQILAEYDSALTKAGVSTSSKGGDRPKYVAKASGSGSSSGRSSSGIISGMATNSFSGSPQRLKEIAATYSNAQGAIPSLRKAKNNDTSRLKKIKVTKGVV